MSKEPCRHGMFSHKVCEICAEVLPLEKQLVETQAERAAAISSCEIKNEKVSEYSKHITELTKQLAEAQALLKDKDDALEYCIKDLTVRAALSEDDSLNISQGCLDNMHKALAQTSGTDVLDKMLEAERVKVWNECLKVADEQRLRIANIYADRVKHGTSKMDGNCDWYKLEGAVAVVQTIRNLG